MPVIVLRVTDPRSRSTLPTSDLRTPTMPFDPVVPSFDLAADFWSLRYVVEESEYFAVRKSVPQPFSATTDRGLMATVYVDGGYGYAATADVSPAGARAALERAHRWAKADRCAQPGRHPNPAAAGAARRVTSPAVAAPRTPRQPGTNC